MVDPDAIRLTITTPTRHPGWFEELGAAALKRAQTIPTLRGQARFWGSYVEGLIINAEGNVIVEFVALEKERKP